MSVKIEHAFCGNFLNLSVWISSGDSGSQVVIILTDHSGNLIFKKKVTGEYHRWEIDIKNHDFIILKIETGYDVILKKIPRSSQFSASLIP